MCIAVLTQIPHRHNNNYLCFKNDLYITVNGEKIKKWLYLDFLLRNAVVSVEDNFFTGNRTGLLKL